MYVYQENVSTYHRSFMENASNQMELDRKRKVTKKEHTKGILEEINKSMVS